MADKSISQLSSATTPLAGTETLPIVQGGSTVKTTVQDVADLAGGGLPYLVYTALLTQSGTNPPVATVLQNTLGGAVTWNRTFVPGPNLVVYFATSSGLFTVGKTTILCGGITQKPGAAYINITNGNPYIVFGNSQELDTPNYVTVEIRVYP